MPLFNITDIVAILHKAIFVNVYFYLDLAYQQSINSLYCNRPNSIFFKGRRGILF